MIAKRERESVVALCRDLVARGFLAATGGNVALRVDAERFAVTPSAMDYSVMTAADVCVLDLADLKRVDGDRQRFADQRAGARGGLVGVD